MPKPRASDDAYAASSFEVSADLEDCLARLSTSGPRAVTSSSAGSASTSTRTPTFGESTSTTTTLGISDGGVEVLGERVGGAVLGWILEFESSFADLRFLSRSLPSADDLEWTEWMFPFASSVVPFLLFLPLPLALTLPSSLPPVVVDDLSVNIYSPPRT